MKSKIELCILIGTLDGGGAERIGVTIAEYFSRICPVLLAILVKLKHEKYIPTVKPCYLIKKSVSSTMLYIVAPIIAIRFFSLLIKKRPKIVLSILLFENIINMFISPFLRVKPIISIHNMRSQSIHSNFHFRLLIPIEMFLLKHRKVTAIVPSNGVKNDLVNNFGISENKVKVIYNPININEICKLSKEAIPDGIIHTGCPTIITVGRLTAVKAQWHLIRVFAAVCKHHPARLLICGVGKEESYLKLLVNELGISESVIFLGWQDNPYKYMACSTVFVLSSLSEAFGNVLIEAMAAGCPVISANCSSCVREIIGDNNEYGLLSEPMTGIRHRFDEPLDSGEEGLLVLIREIIDNVQMQKKYSEDGKKRAGYFSLEQRITEYDLFIRDLIVGK